MMRGLIGDEGVWSVDRSMQRNPIVVRDIDLDRLTCLIGQGRNDNTFDERS